MSCHFVKDPDATLDYVVDWSTWLGADTIITVQWIPDAGITIAQTAHSDTAATVWVSGGAPRERHLIVCRIETAAGRVDDRTIRIDIQDR